jgi:hypothetical protein
VGYGVRRKVAQIIYTHVSLCKNDKIKFKIKVYKALKNNTCYSSSVKNFLVSLRVTNA